MIAQQSGSIVNLGSHVTHGGLYRTPYAVSKGGIEAMTRTLAAENGRHGIRVNAVSPGSTSSPDQVTSRLTLRPGVVAGLYRQHVDQSFHDQLAADGDRGQRRAARPRIIATALLQATGAVGGFMVGYLLDRVGIVGVACTILLGAPCLVGLAYADTQAALMVTVAGLGFFMIGSQTGLNALASTVYPTFMRSTGAGWSTGMGRIGAMPGPVIGGALMSLGPGRTSLFLVAALPLLVASASLFALSRTRAGRAARVGRAHAHHDDRPDPSAAMAPAAGSVSFDAQPVLASLERK